MRIPHLLLTAALLTFSAQAQNNEFHRNHISVSLGPAIPGGNSSNFLSTAPAAGVRYGYRLNRYLQADAGLHIAWGAADNQNAVITDAGQVQGGDHEFMLPLGGRLILPLPFKRLESSVGGGGVYLHYSETAPSGGYYQNSCYSCTSRGGWGGYALGNVSYFLDSDRVFHVGTTVEYISAHTNGDAVGNVPSLRTTDHWLVAGFEFGLNF
jgi:hypothetical protein